MICDIAIPIWNKIDLTARCIDSIFSNTDSLYRLILIDNASEAEARLYLEGVAHKNPDKVKLIVNKENLGNTAAGVQGMRYSDADYVCILDNDTIVCKGWLKEMIKVAESADNIGIINPSSNTFGLRKKSTETLDDFSGKLLRENSGKYVEIGAAIGFCYLVKRKVINEIGVWDERFSPGYFEDTEYSMRAKQKGYKSIMALGSYVYHEEHASFKSKEQKKKFQKIFNESREKFYALYGKPKRILYVIDKHVPDPAYFNNRILEEANKGNFIDVILRKDIAGIKLIEHGNIRKFMFGKTCFKFKIWLKMATKKKKYDESFIDKIWLG